MGPIRLAVVRQGQFLCFWPFNRPIPTAGNRGAVSGQPRPDDLSRDIPSGHITDSCFLLLDLGPIKFAAYRLAFRILVQERCHLVRPWLRILRCGYSQAYLEHAAIVEDLNRATVDNMGRARYFSLCQGGKRGHKAEQADCFHGDLPGIQGNHNPFVRLEWRGPASEADRFLYST